MADSDNTNSPDAQREEGTAGAAAPAPYVDTGGPVDHDDSVSGGLGGTDAGSPGGMGGSRASGGTSNGNPPGGISPLQIEQETTGSPDDER
jgi:hypothetical protein